MLSYSLNIFEHKKTTPISNNPKHATEYIFDLHFLSAILRLVHPVPDGQKMEQPLWQDSRIRSCPQSDKLPKENAETPDIALAGVQMIA